MDSQYDFEVSLWSAINDPLWDFPNSIHMMLLIFFLRKELPLLLRKR
jgi:hypothetical protein